MTYKQTDRTIDGQMEKQTDWLTKIRTTFLVMYVINNNPNPNFKSFHPSIVITTRNLSDLTETYRDDINYSKPYSNASNLTKGYLIDRYIY